MQFIFFNSIHTFLFNINISYCDLEYAIVVSVLSSLAVTSEPEMQSDGPLM